MRLKQAGMEFAVWVFKHAATEQLRDAAPVILQRLLHLLDDGEQSLSIPFRTASVHTYTVHYPVLASSRYTRFSYCD